MPFGALRGHRTPGDHGLLAIPVPIPNTVVKRKSPMILLCEKVGRRRGFFTRPVLHKRWAFFFVCAGCLAGALSSEICLRAPRSRDGCDWRDWRGWCPIAVTASGRRCWAQSNRAYRPSEPAVAPLFRHGVRDSWLPIAQGTPYSWRSSSHWRRNCCSIVAWLG